MENNVLLTTDHVVAWKQRRDKLQAMISDLNAERVLLDKKIEASALFMDEPATSGAAPSVKVPTPSQSASVAGRPSLFSSVEDSKISLVDAIFATLIASGKPLSNAEIKRKLGATGYNVERLKTSPNYFYTATKRLVDKGVAQKLPDGSYMSVKVKAPEDKTTDPVSSEASFERDFTNRGTPSSSSVKPRAGGGT